MPAEGSAQAWTEESVWLVLNPAVGSGGWRRSVPKQFFAGIHLLAGRSVFARRPLAVRGLLKEIELVVVGNGMDSIIPSCNTEQGVSHICEYLGMLPNPLVYEMKVIILPCRRK